MTLKSHVSSHTRVSIDSHVTSISRASAASRRFFPDEVETPRSNQPDVTSPTDDFISPNSSSSVGAALQSNPFNIRNMRMDSASNLGLEQENFTTDTTDAGRIVILY